MLTTADGGRAVMAAKEALGRHLNQSLTNYSQFSRAFEGQEGLFVESGWREKIEKRK